MAWHAWSDAVRVGWCGIITALCRASVTVCATLVDTTDECIATHAPQSIKSEVPRWAACGLFACLYFPFVLTVAPWCSPCALL